MQNSHHVRSYFWPAPLLHPEVLNLSLSLSPLLHRTTEQQQRFHEICGNLVKTQRRVLGWWKRLFTLKEEKPKAVGSRQVQRHNGDSLSSKGVGLCSPAASVIGHYKPGPVPW